VINCKKLINKFFYSCPITFYFTLRRRWGEGEGVGLAPMKHKYSTY
jgi:hypothetical protein